MFRKNKLSYGLILGLLAPLLGMIGFYYWKFRPLTFAEFIQYLGMQKQLVTSMVSVSLLANAVLFTIFINSKKDQTAMGIFIITCIYAVAALVFKLVA